MSSVLRYPKLVLGLTMTGVLMSPGSGAAQDAARSRALGVTAQIYPAGFMFEARASFAVRDRSTLNFGVGYNVTDRRDFGEHGNEEGGGPGLGFTARWYLRERYDGFHLGLSTHLWFLEIDWEDPGPRSGTTDVVVLQPTAQAGYSRTLTGGRIVLDATVSLGVEMNVHTTGEPVGKGAILLGGVGVAYRF